jgi:protein-S-isoprenylcysteine O-methyltransferase Ste14
MPGHEGHRVTLGSEHPLCDSIQMVFLLLLLVVWGIDTFSHFLFGISTVFVQVISFPLTIIPTILAFGIGYYFVMGSHELVFDETIEEAKLIDSGVFARVRHPMYFGILLFYLGFIFLSLSLASLVIWIAFFVFYDRMAAYEEQDLIRAIGDEYVEYQKRVPKWLPRIRTK